MTDIKEPRVKFIHLLLPLVFLSILIGYGLIWRPQFAGQQALPLEVVFLLASCFSITQLLLMGFSWEVVQDAIISKIARGFPAILILFAIGIIIGSWIVSGTMPMLVYWGIKIINPDYIYLLAFIIPIVFSLLTGTSWGSVGTIGVVIIGVASTIQADLGITAGAIIGGAYFGDKLSPLSDTTNIAAIATEVDLYDHIRSMVNTTLPSALIAGAIFFVMGFIRPPAILVINEQSVGATLAAISEMFSFNILLLVPPIIVLYGSIKRKPTLPVLLGSALSAILLAFIFQDFKTGDILLTLATGFDTSMSSMQGEIPVIISGLFNRGGLYELNEAIMFTFMVFVFIGSLDILDAMPTIVRRAFKFVKKRSWIIISSLFASAFTNATTSNQSATSFIVGDAFKKKYDDFGIPRKVLSRSIEDYGTMIESIIPWTATAIFMSATTGVAFADYWYWQLLSLINIVIAPILAITGIGCFYNEKKLEK
jgi:Na+:H+ antiporter, NhaC family